MPPKILTEEQIGNLRLRHLIGQYTGCYESNAENPNPKVEEQLSFIEVEARKRPDDDQAEMYRRMEHWKDDHVKMEQFEDAQKKKDMAKRFYDNVFLN